MATSIKELVEKVQLSPDKIQSVKWDTPINCKSEGVYIISMSDTAESKITMEEFPISIDILKNWIKKLDYFTLDGEKTKDANKIKNRLAEFWLPDESILYIGKAPLRNNGKGGIGNRVKEYYNTAIGERSPHAGGHWIKLLENLEKLHVFYIPCNNSTEIEKRMIDTFGKSVSESTKERLSEKGPILPFANLKDGNNVKKKHEIGHMKLN
ncbi:hypothetical protein [uncultured Bacteroides sp.]|uniref:hypothetical protein n=1 Tax=uncultured Bacteroides sp. TaxID=162156 RepID=UPI0025A93DD0|nr:hypothetical protein [uncultured Bacteroides sp.]